ncbi:MAG: GNAT family N-acetyltransferase [Desulfobacterales bacterium]|nr:GNAT family N-acetyltransferase [Desulfobacterales bacterium]
MDKLFQPKSVAVIGASQATGSIGATLMRNLIHGQFTGEIFPINAQEKKVWDLPTRPHVKNLDGPVDLAVLAVDAADLPKAVRACTEAGICRLALISSGSRDSIDNSSALESRIRAEADLTGIRLIGPNSMGFACPHAGLYLSAARHRPIPGSIAFISQSSTIAATILDLSIRERIGFSHFISLGTMMDVDFADIIDYLGNDPKVGSIVLYVEHLRKLRPFMSAARAVSRIKPIIALKAGRRNSRGPDSPVNLDAAYDAAFQRAGIVRVDTFEELFDCAELLAKQPRPSGDAMAILTNGCGPGIMAADALARYGLKPAELSAETLNNLTHMLPELQPTNPLDLLADATPEHYRQAAEICLAAREVNSLMIVLSPHVIAQPEAVARSLADLLTGNRRPVFTSWMGGPAVEESRRVLNEAGIASFETPERAIRAFNNLLRYKRNLAMLQEIPSSLPRELSFDTATARQRIESGIKSGGQLTDSQIQDLLGAYGILSATVERLDPASAHSKTGAPPQGMLVVGAIQMNLLGPVLYLGMGGEMTGIFQNLAIALPPLNRLLARRMVEASPVHRFLERHCKGVTTEQGLLEEVLVRLGQLVSDFPEITAVEINPLAVSPTQISAVCTRVQLSASSVAAPMHLIISPYPRQYETRITTRDDTALFIRPIRPEDAPLMEQHFASLSPRSVYRRFFTPMRQLSPKMLARFTQIDYDREIALVALADVDGRETLLAVARIITERSPDRAEFSVVAADRWQGKGIGAALLQRCLDIARQWGIVHVHGTVLSENTQMLALGKKLGFRVKRITGTSEYELTLDLEKGGSGSALPPAKPVASGGP